MDAPPNAYISAEPRSAASSSSATNATNASQVLNPTATASNGGGSNGSMVNLDTTSAFNTRSTSLTGDHTLGDTTTTSNNTNLQVVDQQSLPSLGICCMANKASSTPMQNILRRLQSFFRLEIFAEETILNEPIELWPVVDCLISFDSIGFPLEKACQYVELRKPIEINALNKQSLLRNRHFVYEKLREFSIPSPNYVLVTDHNDANRFQETVDYIVWDGQKVYKPFVEKPIDGDDHNIYVYYPMNTGGGIKRLFRKVHNKSSEYDPDVHYVRHNMPYIYEPFISTGGTDIKVYTLGPNYSHGEARKAPTVDGAVQRSKDGKEVRYPIILSQIEKQIAQTIVDAFGQAVCGFDILRTKGFFPVVCDVNGWSFVKGNQKYYTDAAVQLKRFFYDKLKEQTVRTSGVFGGLDADRRLSLLNYLEHDPNRAASAPQSTATALTRDIVQQTFADAEYFPNIASAGVGDSTSLLADGMSSAKPTNFLGTTEEEENTGELKSVLVIMRHGDRKPKEKLKFRTQHPIFLQYVYKGPPPGTIAANAENPDGTVNAYAGMGGNLEMILRKRNARMAAAAGEDGAAAGSNNAAGVPGTSSSTSATVAGRRDDSTASSSAVDRTPVRASAAEAGLALGEKAAGPGQLTITDEITTSNDNVVSPVEKLVPRKGSGKSPQQLQEEGSLSLENDTGYDDSDLVARENSNSGANLISGTLRVHKQEQEDDKNAAARAKINNGNNSGAENNSHTNGAAPVGVISGATGSSSSQSAHANVNSTSKNDLSTLSTNKNPSSPEDPGAASSSGSHVQQKAWLPKEQTKEITIKSVDDLKKLLAEVEGIIEELTESINLQYGTSSGFHQGADRAQTDKEDNSTSVAVVQQQQQKSSSTTSSSAYANTLVRERHNMELLREILCLHDKFTGLNRKVQLKPIVAPSSKPGLANRVTQIQVVAKWGGEITKVGREQAENLGCRLRMCLYPPNESLLALHSTFRHNFKIYSSLEGRCQVTAAAFTKGFLDLVGDLTPILVSMVTTSRTAQELLDEPIPKHSRELVKKKIDSLLHTKELTTSVDDFIERMVPSATRLTGLTHVLRVMLEQYKSPHALLRKLMSQITIFIDRVHSSIEVNEDSDNDSGASDNEHPPPRGVGPHRDLVNPQQLPRLLDDKGKSNMILKRLLFRWRKLLFGFVKESETKKSAQSTAQSTAATPSDVNRGQHSTTGGTTLTSNVAAGGMLNNTTATTPLDGGTNFVRDTRTSSHEQYGAGGHITTMSTKLSTGVVSNSGAVGPVDGVMGNNGTTRTTAPGYNNLDNNMLNTAVLSAGVDHTSIVATSSATGSDASVMKGVSSSGSGLDMTKASKDGGSVGQISSRGLLTYSGSEDGSLVPPLLQTRSDLNPIQEQNSSKATALNNNNNFLDDKVLDVDDPEDGENDDEPRDRTIELALGRRGPHPADLKRLQGEIKLAQQDDDMENKEELEANDRTWPLRSRGTNARSSPNVGRTIDSDDFFTDSNELTTNKSSPAEKTSSFHRESDYTFNSPDDENDTRGVDSSPNSDAKVAGTTNRIMGRNGNNAVKNLNLGAKLSFSSSSGAAGNNVSTSTAGLSAKNKGGGSSASTTRTGDGASTSAAHSSRMHTPADNYAGAESTSTASHQISTRGSSTLATPVTADHGTTSTSSRRPLASSSAASGATSKVSTKSASPQSSTSPRDDHDQASTSGPQNKKKHQGHKLLSPRSHSSAASLHHSDHSGTAVQQSPSSAVEQKAGGSSSSGAASMATTKQITSSSSSSSINKQGNNYQGMMAPPPGGGLLKQQQTITNQQNLHTTTTAPTSFANSFQPSDRAARASTTSKQVQLAHSATGVVTSGGPGGDHHLPHQGSSATTPLVPSSSKVKTYQSKYIFDTSKIPEIYDNIYYDLTHRREELDFIDCRHLAEKVFNLVLPLNCWVTTAEFGISIEEKKTIGAEVSWRLAEKIVGDLEFMLDSRDEAGKKMSLTGHSSQQQNANENNNGGGSSANKGVSNKIGNSGDAAGVAGGDQRKEDFGTSAGAQNPHNSSTKTRPPAPALETTAGDVEAAGRKQSTPSPSLSPVAGPAGGKSSVASSTAGQLPGAENHAQIMHVSLSSPSTLSASSQMHITSGAPTPVAEPARSIVVAENNNNQGRGGAPQLSTTAAPTDSTSFHSSLATKDMKMEPYSDDSTKKQSTRVVTSGVQISDKVLEQGHRGPQTSQPAVAVVHQEFISSSDLQKHSEMMENNNLFPNDPNQNPMHLSPSLASGLSRATSSSNPEAVVPALAGAGANSSTQSPGPAFAETGSSGKGSPEPSLLHATPRTTAIGTNTTFPNSTSTKLLVDQQGAAASRILNGNTGSTANNGDRTTSMLYPDTTTREEALRQLRETYEADVQQQVNEKEEFSDIVGKTKKKTKPSKEKASVAPGGGQLQQGGTSSGSLLQPTTPLSEYAGSISGGMLIPDNYGEKSKVDEDIKTETANSEMSNESPDQKLEKNQRQNSGLSDNSRTNKTASVTDSPLNQIVPLISSSPEIQKQSSGAVSPANRTAGSAGTAVSSVASNGGAVDAAASSLQNKKISEADRAVNAHLSKEQDRLLAGSEVERLTRNTGMSGRATGTGTAAAAAAQAEVEKKSKASASVIGTTAGAVAASTSSGQAQEQGNNAAGSSNSNVGSTTSTKPQEQTNSTNLVGEVDQQSKSSSTAKKLEKSLSNPPAIVGAQSGGTTAGSASASTHPAGGAPAPATASSAQQKQKTIKNEYKWKGEDWFPNRTDNLNTIRSRVYVTSASTMHTFLNILAYFRPMKNHQNQHGMVSNSNSGQSSAGNDSSSDNNNYGGSYDVDDQLPEGVYYDWDVISDLTDMSYMSHLVLRCFELKNVPKDATTLQRYRVEVLVSFGISLTDRDDPKKIIELCSLPDGSFCRKEQQVIAPLKCIMKAPLNYFDSLMQEVHNLSIGGTSSTGAQAGTTASSSGATAGAGFLSSGGGGGAAVPTGMNLISAMVGIGGAGTTSATTAGGKSSTPPAAVAAPAGTTASST
ncbi:unnamed protein product [Amoebophrya sp. A120]|nr:unnamed protein product [Amoebophrya sp. A120]|eukprot:GSA120T00009396001.1